MRIYRKSLSKHFSLMLAFILLFTSIITPLESVYANQESRKSDMIYETTQTVKEKNQGLIQNLQIPINSINNLDEPQIVTDSINQEGDEVISVTDSVYQVDNTTKDLSALGTPNNIEVYFSDGTAIITWDAVIGAIVYEVYRNGELVGTCATTSYVDTDLSNMVEYVYTVKTYGILENSIIEDTDLVVQTMLASTISTDTTLTTTEAVYGDLYLTGGVLDLNGQSLEVYGNLFQQNGIIRVNNGTLNISGDYKIESSTGSYCSGVLQMTGAADKVVVGGSFVTDSNVDHSQYLTSGILEVKGDFTQRCSYISSYSFKNFNASGTHRVLLSGSNIQEVSFAYYNYSGFNTLVINKPLDIGYIFNHQPVWVSLMTMEDDNEPPTIPTNLTVKSKSASSVSLTWTYSTDNIVVEKYVILRDGIEIGETADTSFVDTGLLPNTTYTYSVKAYDRNNNSSNQSNIVAVMTDEKPDWYYVRTTDLDGNLLEVYLSDIGASAGESNETISAIVKGSSDIVWKEYELCEDIWTANGNTYASAPGGGIVVTAVQGLKENNIAEASVTTMELPTIFNIDLEAKKDEILDKIYDKIGIDPRELTAEDIKMLSLGVAYSIDDNVTFCIVQWLHDNTTGIEPPEDNYYYMRAKAYTDAMFVAAYTTATLGSAAAAASALESAGLSGGMALATSPTGAGTVVFGTAAVTELAGAELAGAAVIAGVSYASGNMAERSQNILRSSVAKLQQTLGYKIRNVADDILDRFEGYKGGHTIEKHVSMTNEELIRRANQEGIDATSFENKSIAISSVQQNLRKNADNIEEWLKNTSNQTLTVEMTHQYPVGYGVTANSTNVTYNLIKSRAILIRDDTVNLGFYILTSFPTF